MRHDRLGELTIAIVVSALALCGKNSIRSSNYDYQGRFGTSGQVLYHVVVVDAGKTTFDQGRQLRLRSSEKNTEGISEKKMDATPSQL